MFAGISAIFGAIFSVVAKIISYVPWWVWVCFALILFGGWIFNGGSCRDFACGPRRVKPIKWEELTVSSATTGASLECRVGARGRRTRSVNLAHIEVPLDISDESRSSLERLAGNVIRIPFQGIIKRPLVDLLKPVSAAPESAESKEDPEFVQCDVCKGSGEIWDTCIVVCYFCQRDPECPECKGLGRMRLSFDTIDQCEAAIIKHIGDDGCKECQELAGPCPTLRQQLKNIIAINPEKPQKIKCPECDGIGKYPRQPLEAKVIVSLVYSSYGQCLNTEQVRLGMAKLLPDAPKDWKKFEDEAKKKNLGVWKATNGSHRR